MKKLILLIFSVVVALFIGYFPMSIIDTTFISGEEGFIFEWLPCPTDLNSPAVKWLSYFNGSIMIVTVILCIFLTIRILGIFGQSGSINRYSFIAAITLSTIIDSTVYMIMLGSFYIVGYDFAVIILHIASFIFMVVYTTGQATLVEQNDGVFSFWNAMYNFLRTQVEWDDRIRFLNNNYKNLIS